MSQFERLSPNFRDALQGMADKMAQCGTPAPAGAEVGTGPEQKQGAVEEVLSKMSQFTQRMVREWLYSLEDQELSEVGRLFDEINEMSAMDMKCCPFRLVAEMLSGDSEEKPEQVVVEADISVPPVSPDGEKQCPMEVHQEQSLPVPNKGMEPEVP